MKPNFQLLEQQRLALQAALDAEKTRSERNKMGQFATPPELARDILRYAVTLLPAEQPIRFLDPAIGTGSFYSALQSVVPGRRIVEAAGFEVDPHYGGPAETLWSKTGLCLTLADFTRQIASPRFNLLICNPPYVRHQHLEAKEKARLQLRTAKSSGIQVSGLAGLYCHFVGLSHGWMAEGSIAGWLIPSEFMDVNYGDALKKYLLDKVTLLHIHRFAPSDVQFADALVSSAIVWFKNAPPPSDHTVTFSYGGSLSAPEQARAVSARDLADEPKWTRFPVSATRAPSVVPTLSDFFKVKRGVATGGNAFFILPEAEIIKRKLPMQVFRPILPSPRYLNQDVIDADTKGNPRLDRRLFLLDPRMSEEEIERHFPALWKYLEEGKRRGLHEGYICRHRALWYAQETRPPAPIVCTYIGRSDTKSGRPFRFILNQSQATVANVYLAMYPTPALAGALAEDGSLLRKVWNVLNEITPGDLLDEGRVYGGGLHKLEPKELANVPAGALAALLPRARVLATV